MPDAEVQKASAVSVGVVIDASTDTSAEVMLPGSGEVLTVDSGTHSWTVDA